MIRWFSITYFLSIAFISSLYCGRKWPASHSSSNSLLRRHWLASGSMLCTVDRYLLWLRSEPGCSLYLPNDAIQSVHKTPAVLCVPLCDSCQARNNMPLICDSVGDIFVDKHQFFALP